MSDSQHRPARIHGVRDGRPAGDPGAPATLVPADAHRPESGSPLERLLGRQALGARADRLLGFVPAQVR